MTPRRLVAAERVLARERERLALFASQVLAEQETAQQRIERIEADNRRREQAFRDLAAKHWREGRRMVRWLPPTRQTELLEAWNRSSIPPHAAYFIDFVRTRLRRWGVLADKGATQGRIHCRVGSEAGSMNELLDHPAAMDRLRDRGRTPP